MSVRHHQDSARNGPRLACGYDRCLDCRQIRSKPRAKGGTYCKATGYQIRHPVSGPVLMTCPKRRLPEEE